MNSETIFDCLCLLVIAWALFGIYQDAFIKHSYDWLIENYLPGPELRNKADAEALESIRSRGGASKYTFRKLVMRPLMDP